jgi:hypothetical protein
MHFPVILGEAKNPIGFCLPFYTGFLASLRITNKETSHATRA